MNILCGVSFVVSKQSKRDCRELVHISPYVDDMLYYMYTYVCHGAVDVVVSTFIIEMFSLDRVIVCTVDVLAWESFLEVCVSGIGLSHKITKWQNQRRHIQVFVYLCIITV